MLKKSANKTSLFAVVKTTTMDATRLALFLVLFTFSVSNAGAQNDDFRAKLTERSKKIVNSLSVTDSAVYNAVVSAVAGQYFDLNQVHDNAKTAVTEIKAKNLAKEETDKLLAAAAAQKTAALAKLHTAFLQALSSKISAEQIDKIKDGMTYNVFPITYAAYQNMILSLTDSQKQKIYDWLKEARELAMDEGSSDDKHKVFGKYKGKINNYLSAQGYDVKKEGEEWAKRIDAEKKAKQTQN
jgi:Protein of unknown function (DUF3826)